MALPLFEDVTFGDPVVFALVLCPRRNSMKENLGNSINTLIVTD
jgi:hypothetical protein